MQQLRQFGLIYKDAALCSVLQQSCDRSLLRVKVQQAKLVWQSKKGLVHVEMLLIVTRSKGKTECLLDAMFREQELGEQGCFSDEEILDEAVTFFSVCDVLYITRAIHVCLGWF
jgi:hypothetical protein